MQLLGKMLGDPNKKELNHIQPTIDKINAFEPTIKKLTAEELATNTQEFRARLSLHLKGGMVLEDDLANIFREVFESVEPFAAKLTKDQLHAAITEPRQKIERRRDPEHLLKDNLQDTLSECFEHAYENLNPILNTLRVTAALDSAEETQEWPDEADDPHRATLALLKKVEPMLTEIDDDYMDEAFEKAWPLFEEARQKTQNDEEGADERLESLLHNILQHLQGELVALKAEAIDELIPAIAKRYKTGKTLDDLLPEAFAVVREA